MYYWYLLVHSTNVRQLVQAYLYITISNRHMNGNIPRSLNDGVRTSRRSKKSRASRSTVRLSVVVAESSRARDWGWISPARVPAGICCCCTSASPGSSAGRLWPTRLLPLLSRLPVWLARMQTKANTSVTAEQRTMSTTHTAITTCSQNEVIGTKIPVNVYPNTRNL